MKEHEIIIKVPIKWSKGHLNRKQGLSFDILAWFTMSDICKLPLTELDKLDDETHIVYIILAASKSYNWQRGKKNNYDVDIAQYWLDWMPQKQLKDIWNCMMKSKIGGESLLSLVNKAENSKKKLQSKKSKTTQ